MLEVYHYSSRHHKPTIVPLNITGVGALLVYNILVGWTIEKQVIDDNKEEEDGEDNLEKKRQNNKEIVQPRKLCEPQSKEDKTSLRFQ